MGRIGGFFKVHDNPNNQLLPISASLRFEVLFRDSVEGTKDMAMDLAVEFLHQLKFKALPFGQVVSNLGDWINASRLYPVV